MVTLLVKNEDDNFDFPADLSRVFALTFKRTRLLRQSGLCTLHLLLLEKQLGATKQAEPDCFVPLLLDAGPTETEGQHSYVPATSSGNKTGGVSNAPIEFVFPNGTKMVIRDHADIHLLKTIVHLYD